MRRGVWVGLFVIVAASFGIYFGVDPQRKDKCEWYVVPFPDGNPLVPYGWVSLCVANFELGKQRCYFTAKPEFVEKINGIPFRYSSMKFSENMPHKILSLATCKPEGRHG